MVQRMRVLLTWELGLNVGHLTRLLPVAERLKADGHSVLVATRDIQAAAMVLGSFTVRGAIPIATNKFVAVQEDARAHVGKHASMMSWMTGN
jgi:hypothetical protein